LTRGAIARFVGLTFGAMLMIAAPLVGWVPGPGGTIVFALGLSIVLRNSLWAKRRYVDFKRRYPKPGAWTDWGLRRKSAKRRKERSKIAQSEAEIRGKTD
jgi:hypothetical protein